MTSSLSSYWLFVKNFINANKDLEREKKDSNVKKKKWNDKTVLLKI